MKLYFGNMTLELNIFNLCRQSRDEDSGFQEVDFIDTLEETTLEESSDSASYDPLESS